jgi:hypothetical protein
LTNIPLKSYLIDFVGFSKGALMGVCVNTNSIAILMSYEGKKFMKGGILWFWADSDKEVCRE